MVKENCIVCASEMIFSCEAEKRRRYKTKKCGNCYRKSMKQTSHPNWKGGFTFRSGYKFIRQPEHPFANNIGYVREHRIVMEKHIGRYLNPNEIVHHINHNRLDNRIENLKICASQSEHVSQEHGTDRYKKCTLCENKHLARGFCHKHYWVLFLKGHRSKNVNFSVDKTIA